MSDEYHLGWVDFDQRTNEQNDTHDAIVAAMPSFSLVTETPPVGTKLMLTDVWKHQKVIDVFGGPYPGIKQETGSCVGAGGGVAINTLNRLEVCKNNEAEKVVLGFWLYNYGRSRQLGGMRGRGQGSFGSTFAQSVTKDGWLDARVEDLKLPQPKNNGMLTWGSAVELDWSDGTKASPAVRQEAISRPVRSAAELHDGAAVRDAIMNGYPVTRAFNTFVDIETARVRNGVLIGTYNGRGGHQESWLGYWNHPQEGELIWEQNQWGHKAYLPDPSGGPAGGCWVRMTEVDRQCRSSSSEIYAFSQYEGYPAQPDVYDWLNQSFWS